MEKALITFANGETLEITDSDRLTPLIKVKDNDRDDFFASQTTPVEMIPHTHLGLIVPISDVICCYDFFFLNYDQEKLYGSKSIVKVEQI